MLRVEDYGPVQALHQGRPLFGFLPPFMTVRCYRVDGLLVDSGLKTFSSQTLQWARQGRVERALITHHHEDHSGGANLLADSGIKVEGSKRTQTRVKRGFAVHAYQHLVWGASSPLDMDLAQAIVETSRYRFEVLPAPGHCDDQIVLFEPRQGWLFSGDAFLATRVKYFRGDEDFAATRDSLRRLTQLSFDTLFCAHKPVVTGGRQALLQKLQYLEDLEGKVRDLHQRGLSLRAISDTLLGREKLLLYLVTWGDLSKYNLVRSILQGPQTRPDNPP